MANIVLKTYAAGDDGQGTVTPQDDALIYQNAVPMNGLFSGGTVTLTESNVLHIASGFGIIGGRFFEINDSDISVELSSAGTLLGRVYVHLELTNADVPISIAVATGATLPALEGDANLNITNGNFDLELATFNVSEVTISDIVNTFPTIRKANNQLRRTTAYSVGAMVFCQSASDNLVFICTTAGTTAVQEPKAYQTVTDGNTVTDGTAVFKAVSVSGQITQISKIGNLSNLNTTDKSSTVAAINEVNTKVSKTEDLISIVENGNTCTHTGGISKGQYVNWKGVLYTADSNISVGATFASSGGSKNLTVVTDGGLNELNSDLSDKQDAIKSNMSKRTIVSVSDSEINVIKTFILNAKSRYARVEVITQNGGSNSLIIDSNFLNYCNEDTCLILNSILPDNGAFSWSISLYIGADRICLTSATKGAGVGWLYVYVNEFYQA